MLFNFLNPISASILAFLTSLLIVILTGKKFIAYMHSWQHEGQPIRECGPKSHLKTKKGTPTMGGLLILLSIIFSTLLYAQLSSGFTWICIAVIVVFGATGFWDDYIKIKKHTAAALTARIKLLIQFSVAFAIAIFAISQFRENIKFSVIIPYINFPINLWYFYIPFVMFVIAGTSNSVNLSDGLDGLASGLLIPAFGYFFLSTLLTFNFAPLGNLSIICAATMGACLGFLWHNSFPAKIFMGDTGSLALGALLGTIAVLCKQEIILAIVGIVFVIESLSVMIQVFWYKRTKTRVFLMAPIHHHFEQKGYPETCIVMRFWIVAWIAAVIGIISLFMQSFGGN
ncbi:MAG: phospho-N-acetylmuramoyl-pentapeptide-transferase [Alphaproteobacteria bacterium]|nr:phospho-N-acetylmuramoyl-pentapeptide-transferase [Alphaproteobacteria bacterium]